MRRFLFGLALLALGLGLVLQGVRSSDALTPQQRVVLFAKKAAASAGNFSVVLNGTSQYFTATGKTAINQQKFTIASWFKTSNSSTEQLFYFGDGTTSNEVQAAVSGAGALSFSGTTGGSSAFNLLTSGTFNDGNWHSAVFAMDTTQATANNRGIIYVDCAAAALGTNTQPAQNANLSNNFAATYHIGANQTPGRFFNGKLAQIYYIDGQQLTYSSFNNGSCLPQPFSGSYTGTFDFFLPYSNAAALGADGSGEGNNWTPQGSPTQSADYP